MKDGKGIFGRILFFIAIALAFVFFLYTLSSINHNPSVDNSFNNITNQTLHTTKIISPLIFVGFSLVLILLFLWVLSMLRPMKGGGI